MKRSQGQGKLRLNKESLRVLSGAALARVNGGTYGGEVNPVESTDPNTACDGWVVEVKGGYNSFIPADCTGGIILLPSKIKAGG